MNARDVELVALGDIKCAHAYVKDAHAVLRDLHRKLKKIGVSIHVLDRTLVMISEAKERLGAARLSLSEAVMDERKESFVDMYAQGTV